MESSVQQCSHNKVAKDGKNKAALNDLEVVTDYYIGIQASYDGSTYGTLGRIREEKSCECKKC